MDVHKLEVWLSLVTSTCYNDLPDSCYTVSRKHCHLTLINKPEQDSRQGRENGSVLSKWHTQVMCSMRYIYVQHLSWPVVFLTGHAAALNSFMRYRIGLVVRLAVQSDWRLYELIHTYQCVWISSTATKLSCICSSFGHLCSKSYIIRLINCIIVWHDTWASSVR